MFRQKETEKVLVGRQKIKEPGISKGKPSSTFGNWLVVKPYGHLVQSYSEGSKDEVSSYWKFLNIRNILSSIVLPVMRCANSIITDKQLLTSNHIIFIF